MEEGMRAAIGVDRHEHVLSAVALDGRGASGASTASSNG
jgi:hypothetical protein